MVLFATAKTILPKDENAPEAVAKRGYVRNDGCTTRLTAWVADETGEAMLTIRAEDYLRLGHPIVMRGTLARPNIRDASR